MRTTALRKSPGEVVVADQRRDETASADARFDVESVGVESSVADVVARWRAEKGDVFEIGSPIVKFVLDETVSIARSYHFPAAGAKWRDGEDPAGATLTSTPTVPLQTRECANQLGVVRDELQEIGGATFVLPSDKGV